MGNGVKGYAEIGIVSELKGVPNEPGAPVEGVDGVELVGAALEGTEVAFPNVGDADEEGDDKDGELLPLAKMHGTASRKNDSLRTFRTIAIGVGADVVEVRSCYAAYLWVVTPTMGTEGCILLCGLMTRIGSMA